MIEIHSDFEKISKELKKLDEKTLKKALRSGLVYAIKPLKATLKGEAPDDPTTAYSRIRDSIGHKQLNERKKARLGISMDQVGIFVGPVRKVRGKSWGFLARWAEGGTRPHVIKAKSNRGFLRFGGIFAKKIKHPGVKPNRFIQRSMDKTTSMFQSRFYDGLSRYLNKYGS